MEARFWKYLTRITTSGSYIPEIDGLRFFAIAPVFFHHLDGFLYARAPYAFESDPVSSFLHEVCLFGNFGVQLFFAISGFILSYPFIKGFYEHSPDFKIKQYFLRRLARIEPPYIINLVLCFLLLLIVKHDDFAKLQPNLLASLFYVHNLIYERMSDINCVAWSLEIEVQFYTLVPLILFSLYRAAPRFRYYGYALGYLVFIVFQSCTASKVLWLGTYGQYFTVGIFLADCYYHTACRPFLSPKWYDRMALLGWLGLFSVLYWDSHVKLISPLFMFFAYLGTLRGDLVRRFFSWRVLTSIGSMCYTIYLYHFLCISFFGRFTIKFGASSHFWHYFLWQSVFIGLGTLLVCSVFFVTFERPFMIKNWPTKLRHWLQRKSPVAETLKMPNP